MELNQTLIFGHKNPDTDSIMSSMVMANLENQLGNTSKAVRLGNINKETEYAINYLGIEAPELISDVTDGQNVILVDHNESTQSAGNISNAIIKKVVDHHTELYCIHTNYIIEQSQLDVLLLFYIKCIKNMMFLLQKQRYNDA